MFVEKVDIIIIADHNNAHTQNGLIKYKNLDIVTIADYDVFKFSFMKRNT